MDVLRNLFGNVTSGIVRLAVAAGILFCAYLFIVKPVLDTTNNAIDTTNNAIQSSGLNQLGKSLQHLGPQIERQVKRTFKVTKAQGGNPQRLVECVKHAHQNVEKIERCTRRF
jgi:predicted PurR-regulated permease PerM